MRAKGGKYSSTKVRVPYLTGEVDPRRGRDGSPLRETLIRAKGKEDDGCGGCVAWRGVAAATSG